MEETIGDPAYGGGKLGQIFADADREFAAKVAAHERRDQISKDQFKIDLTEMTCTCPVARKREHWSHRAVGKTKMGRSIRRRLFASRLRIVPNAHCGCGLVSRLK